MRKQWGKISMSRSPRRRFSPLALATIIVPAILILIAVVSLTMPFADTFAKGGKRNHQQQKQQVHKKQKTQQKQAAQQQQQATNCTLTVPADPLSAQGLATPYQLGGGCDEANPMQAAFVQAAIIDPNGNIAVYDPLVVNQDQQPALPPVVPTIQAGSTVGIWFGSNATTLTLKNAGDTNSLTQGNCVNGLGQSIFGQFAYCNAVAFFMAANGAGTLKSNPATPLMMGKDGLPCPTVRDFGVVDQDQSDNVTTTYLITGGKTAQNTAANRVALQNAQTQANGSDNRLVDVALDGALNCTPPMAPDLANPGQMATALPLNELQAAAKQAAPQALVPMGDPMTLVDNNPSTDKTNLYRMGVDQPAVGAPDGGNTTLYCQNLLTIAPQRIVTDAPFTGVANSPDAAAATTLFTFLIQRFQTTYEGPLGTGLQCTGPGQGPIQAIKDGNGVAIAAKITLNGQTQCYMSNGTVDPTGNSCIPPTNTNNTNGNGMSQQQTQKGQNQQGQQHKSRKRRHG